MNSSPCRDQRKAGVCIKFRKFCYQHDQKSNCVFIFRLKRTLTTSSLTLLSYVYTGNQGLIIPMIKSLEMQSRTRENPRKTQARALNIPINFFDSLRLFCGGKNALERFLQRNMIYVDLFVTQTFSTLCAFLNTTIQFRLLSSGYLSIRRIQEKVFWQDTDHNKTYLGTWNGTIFVLL